MKKGRVLFSLLITALTLWGCGTRYVVTGIEHSRILVDKRYDASHDTELQTFIAPYKQRVDSIMAPLVGRAGCYMSAGRPESPLSNLLSDILVWGGERFNEQPQFAVYNIGGMRAAIIEGEVTRGDIINVAPFENKICFITLTGEQVQRLFEQIAKRGGEGVSHSVKLVLDKNCHLLRASIDGKPIDPKAQYRVATIDYVVQGNDGMSAFKEGTQLVSPQSDENNVRYIIMDYFSQQMKAGKAVCGKREGRITIE